MFVTIIAHYLRTVNKNAIVLLTLHRKYYGEKTFVSALPWGHLLRYRAIRTRS